MTISAFNSGAGEVDVSGVIAAMGDTRYHYIGCGFNDHSNRQKVATEMARRYAANLMVGGRAFCALADNVSNLKTYANTQNTPHLSTLDSGTLQNSEAVIAATYTARAAWRFSKDPARPLQHQFLNGIKSRNKQRTATERESLLHAGIATHEVMPSGSVQIHRAITMYRLNSAGVADDSYLDVTTLCTADAVREYQHNTLLLRYPDYKAADTALTVPAGQPIMTKAILAGEFLAIYEDMVEFGWVEDANSYKKSLKVEADAKVSGRFNVLDNPNFITPLRIVAVRSQFELVEQN